MYKCGGWKIIKGIGLKKQVLMCVCLLSVSGVQAQMNASSINVMSEIVATECADRTVEQDLTAQMTITNRHRNGSEKKNVYKRFVMNAQGREQVYEKMLLVSEYPPEAEGMAFLRWEYTTKAAKYPDQWLYSPSLRKVRKISVRDDQERFLGSTLTLGDIGVRAYQRDKHQLLKAEKQGSSYIFSMKSVPKSSDDAYSKRMVTYVMDAGWDSCRIARIEYYDRKGGMLKVQKNQWQQVGETWVWKHVEVENLQTRELSVFELDDVKVNVGLKDDIFSKRKLKRASSIDH